MPTATIAFDFEPLLRLADGLVVRWQTVALIAVIVIGLVVAGLIARREGLRPDDLLFIAVATVPGALVGGRLGYLLLHLDYYGSHTQAIVDPGQGSLELSLGIVGGTLSGAYVASLLGAPIGRWLGTMALPLLLVLGVGKLAMMLGGSGQGQPTDLAWATAYAGAGPWGSLAPALPSHPSQAYEAITTLATLVILTLALAVGAFEARDSRLFFVAFGTWAVARAVVSVTWRDPAAFWVLSVGGLLAVACAIGSVAGFIVVARRPRLTRSEVQVTPDVSWRDPEAPPRF